MSQLSVRDAAYRVGITRQTLFKYIRQGKVNATVGHDGQKQVDVAELIRAFGELRPDTVANGHSSDRRPQSPQTATTTTTTALQLELERMKAQLQFKEAELALAKERIDELKARELDAKHREREATEERMRMLGVIETQNRLLAAPQPIPPIKPPSRPARKTAAAPAKPKSLPNPTTATITRTDPSRTKQIKVQKLSKAEVKEPSKMVNSKQKTAALKKQSAMKKDSNTVSKVKKNSKNVTPKKGR